MITCHLFEADKPQTAKECNITLSVTGWVGQGEAIVRFEAAKRLENAVLHIPTLLFHESGSSASLVPTSSTLQWRDSGIVVKTDELHLTRANWRDQDMERSPLPVSKIKSAIEPTVIAYNGALSPSDVLLSVGDLEEGWELTVRFEFILQFKPVSGSQAIKCVFAALLPSNEVSMKVNMAALSDVISVNLLHDHQPMNLLQVNVDGSKVAATAVGPSHSTPLGIVVELDSSPISNPLKSSCHCLLLENPLNVPLNEAGSKKYYGVQMMSCLPHQDLAQSEWDKLSTSEVLFLVDCSGSMSGKRMQSASEALLLAIKSLPPGCLFNIVAFGSKYRILFQTSMEVTTKYVEKAIQFANQLQACLGGTELLTPLRWLLKKPLQNGLRREVFIITDGGVPNISSVLHSVRKYSLSTRCHTFALGPEICSEVMASIACETGGHYVIVDEETRLQSKIMGVLKSCLQPPVTDLALNWAAPSGYISEKPFHSPETVRLSGAVHTYFTALTKHPDFQKTNGSLSVTPPIITGFLLGERVQGAAELQYEYAPPLSDSGQTLLRSAAWSKMCSLNSQLLNPHKKNNNAEGCDDGGAPPTKRPRLNGSHDSSSNSELVEELVSVSLSSGVPFYPFTHFKSSCQTDDKQRVCQLLPWNGPLKVPSQRKVPSDTNTLTVEVPSRKYSRKRHHYGNMDPSASLMSSVSLSSITKRTTSSITSAFKSAVNIATFGLVNMESSDPSLEGGERVEDQDYYQNKGERIHWDTHHRLVLPKIYYQSHSSTETGSNNFNHSDSCAHQTHSSVGMECSGGDFADRHSNVEQSMDCTHFNGGFKNSEESSDDSGSEDKLISDITDETSGLIGKSADCSHGDCSHGDYLATDSYPPSGVSLRPDYIALVQLQLPLGGWPLIPAISIATGVSMNKIMNLPTKNGYSKSLNGTNSSSSPSRQTEAGHVWATVFAIACLREHFPHLKIEWDLLVMKGEAWLRERKDSIPLSLVDAQEKAIEIIPKTI